MLTPAILAHRRRNSRKAARSRSDLERAPSRADGFAAFSPSPGSVNPPRLIVIEYHGGGKRETPLPSSARRSPRHRRHLDQAGAAMDEMKWDKWRPRVSALCSRPRSQLPLNLIGLIPPPKTCPAGRLSPGDIITTRDGKPSRSQHRRGGPHHPRRRDSPRAADYKPSVILDIRR